jgi:hypothetical protein
MLSEAEGVEVASGFSMPAVDGNWLLVIQPSIEVHHSSIAIQPHIFVTYKNIKK